MHFFFPGKYQKSLSFLLDIREKRYIPGAAGSLFNQKKTCLRTESQKLKLNHVSLKQYVTVQSDGNTFWNRCHLGNFVV
jgi:hypothetical protein